MLLEQTSTDENKDSKPDESAIRNPQSAIKLRFAVKILLAALFVMPLLAWLSGEILIVNRPVRQQADVIFVFSGSAAYAERTDKAAELFHAGRAAKIVITNDGEKAGWEKGLQRNPFYWEWERWNLISKGVPEDAIEVLPTVIRGTNDEAVLLEQTARERGWKSIQLVTSPLHTRRALWIVNRVFARNGEQIEIGIEPSATENKSRFWWQSRKNWQMLAGEYVKFVYYWLFY